MPAADASATPPVRVLGPVLVAGPDGTPNPPRGVRAAMLLAALALADGAPVTVPGLVDRLWPDEAPADPRAALHNLVSRLRQTAAPDAVRSVPTGYALGCESDLSLARGGLARGRAALRAGRAEEAGRLAASALGLWWGEPGADLGAVGAELRATAARLHAELTALRREAAEAVGDDVTVAALASDALAADPLDEDAARSLMTALAAQGRGAEAVRVYGRLRHAFVAELGTDPAPDLVALHDRLLAAAQDQVPGGAPLRSGGAGTPDASSDAAPRRARHVALGLRAAPNPLVGRAGDVAAFESALRTSRLVTVLGAGGLGKTRLAQEVARRATAATPLVVVVELAGVRSDYDVVLALADTLGLAAGGTARLADRLLAGDVHDQVLARLRGTACLVVLDNCEHVAAGAARWAHELLGAVPELRILATSRAPLRLTAEQTFPLAPLAADGAGVGTGPAVELFRQRARAARPDVRLPDDVVVRLCDRLDGLPLAIELAAARVRALSIEEIEQHLDERFALLRSGDAAAPDRHRTLEAVIEWSWNLLTPSQQALWRRVAILPDGFGVDAAAAIGGLGAGSPLDVLDDVDGLVTQSLLAVADDGGVARYRMLETVREFGLLRLAAAGEQGAVRDALLDWAAALARRDVAVLLGPGQVAAIAELVRDQENLLYAFRTAAEAPPEGTRARRPEVVVHTFVGLAASWALRGSEERAAGLAATVLGALHGWPVPDEDADVTAVALAFALGALVTGGTAAGDVGGSRARTLARLRLLLRRPGLDRRTRVLLSLVLLPDWAAMVREVQDLRHDPDPLVAFAACICAGQGAENDGQLVQALRDAEDAYERSAGVGDVACPAFAALFAATTASEVGDFATALAWTDRVRPGFTALGATSAQRQLDWIELSAVLEAGDAEAAEALCDRLEVPGDWPDERGGAEMAAVAAAGRGEAALLRGDAEAAVAHYADAMSAFGDAQGPGTPWVVMLGSAQVVRLVGLERHDEARDALARLGRRAVALSRDWMPQFLDRPVLGTACLAAATVRAAAGDRDPGVADLFALAEAIGSRQDIPALRRGPLLATAASLLGAGALDEGRARVAAMTHDQVTEHALALLDEVAGEGERR